jgi:signal peptidase I
MLAIRIAAALYSFVFIWGVLREHFTPWVAIAWCGAVILFYLRMRRLALIRRAGTALVLLLHIEYCVCSWMMVRGPSMEPSYHDGDIVFVRKWPYGWILPPLPGFRSAPYVRLSESLPAEGDAVVLRYPGLDPGGDSFLLKRIAALPGEHYRFADGNFIVNGKVRRSISAQPLVVQPPVFSTPDSFSDPFVVYAAANGVPTDGIVPPGFVLVLGDNSANSRDSRSIGFIPLNFVMGVCK